MMQSLLSADKKAIVKRWKVRNFMDIRKLKKVKKFSNKAIKNNFFIRNILE